MVEDRPPSNHPRSYPQVSDVSCFDCLAPPSRHAGRQIAHGQFAGREDRQETIGPDVEAAIGDTSCGRWVLGSRRG